MFVKTRVAVLTRLALCACLTLAVASFAMPAHAFQLCEEGKADADADEPAAAEPEPERVILPCALADGVSMGGAAGCADAAVYVVTTAGVLLCQIDIPALADAGSGAHFEDAPALPAPPPSSAFTAAAAAAASGARLPPVFARVLAAAPTDGAGGLRDGHARFSVPPS